MKKLVLFILLLMVITTEVVAQQETTRGGAGLFYSPMMQQLNLDWNELLNLRRQNKDLAFDVSIGNDSDEPLNMKIFVGHLAQEEGVFRRATLIPQADIYRVQPEEATNPEASLRNIAKKIYGDEEKYLLIIRLNGLKQDYKLPDTLLIPRIKTEIYTVKSGDLLSRIAKSFYGDEGMGTLIAEINGLTKPYQLFEGQQLYLIKMQDKYIVQEGETLEDIAEHFGDTGLIYLIKLSNPGLTLPYPTGTALNIPEIKDKYTVQAGDTLQSIAGKKDVYGDEAGAVVLARANGLEMSYTLWEGQSLYIPQTRPQRYTVQAGDTLESIAQKIYNDETGAMLIGLLNGIVHSQQLMLGQTLYIPEVQLPKYSATSWITPEETAFTLKPHESRRVGFKIKIPRDLNIDATYSAIVGAEVAMDVQVVEGIQSMMLPAGNTTVLLNISGRRPQPRKAELHSFEIQKMEDKLMILVFGLRNLGRSMIQVQDSKVLILREDRTRVFEPMPLGEGPRIVLPENRLELGTGIAPLPPGKYIVQATVDYDGRSPAFMERAFEITEGAETKGRARTVSFSVTSPEGEEELSIPVQIAKRNVRGEMVRVQNHEYIPLHFEVKLQDIPGIDSKFSAKDVLEVQPTSFDLAPLKSRNIRVTLRDPKAQAGGRYAQVSVEGAMVTKGAGEVEFLSATRIMEIYEISTAELEYKFESAGEAEAQFKKGLLLLKTRLKNTGNIHLKPDCVVSIMDAIGQGVFAAKVNLPDYIYPSEEKLVTPLFDLRDKDIAAGIYTVQIFFSYSSGEPVKLTASFEVPEEEDKEEAGQGGKEQ